MLMPSESCCKISNMETFDPVNAIVRSAIYAPTYNQTECEGTNTTACGF